jgi:hypothetical protein
MTVTIYHNPQCGTSRNVLGLIRNTGEEPVIIEAWLKKCHFQVTPEIDRDLMVKGFLVLGVTLI